MKVSEVQVSNPFEIIAPVDMSVPAVKNAVTISYEQYGQKLSKSRYRSLISNAYHDAHDPRKMFARCDRIKVDLDISLGGEEETIEVDAWFSCNGDDEVYLEGLTFNGAEIPFGPDIAHLLCDKYEDEVIQTYAIRRAEP